MHNLHQVRKKFSYAKFPCVGARLVGIIFLFVVDGTWKNEEFKLITDHPVFNEMPTMPKLHHLKLPGPDGETIDIAERIGTYYDKFGTLLLDDHYNLVQIIYRDNMKEIVATNVNILTKWLAGKGKHPVTWRTLIEVMEAVKENELAHQVKEALTSHS